MGITVVEHANDRQSKNLTGGVMMRRTVRLLCLGTAAIITAMGAGGAAYARGADSTRAGDTSANVPAQGFTAAQLQQQINSGATIKTWSHTITALGSKYTYTMVGQSPFVAHSDFTTTDVATFLIPVKFEFPDGTSTDPTQADPTCSPQGTAYALTKASPLFGEHNYKTGGVVDPSVQYIDHFQRVNFYKYTADQPFYPSYHIDLALQNFIKATVKVSADKSITTGVKCGTDGVNIDWWEGVVEDKLLSDIAGFVGPKQLPIFLFYRTGLYQSGDSSPTIGGYHTAVPNSAYGGSVQTYVTADYKPSNDIEALSHELGEWLDDPFTNNPVPAWGHIGQQSGCQGNLEVGDPLSGTTVPVKMSNGFTYHPQELAFVSWFYRQNPSIGVNGWFSSKGTFTSDAGPVCS